VKKRRIHIWERSVSLDKEGVAWLGGIGTRADFVYDLFMKGWSTAELADGLCDGYMTVEQVDDAIRYGMWKRRRSG